MYYPDVKQILGKPVYRKLTDIPDEVDLVNVFRRSEDVPKHLDEMLAKKPKAVWLQLGIQNDEVARNWRRPASSRPEPLLDGRPPTARPLSAFDRLSVD